MRASGHGLRASDYVQRGASTKTSTTGEEWEGAEGEFEHGVAHALSSEPFSLVRGATAIISPLGLTSTSVVAMLALLVGAIGTGGSLAASSALAP